MQITILGPGCRNCAALERNARAALATTGTDAEIVKITDYAQIAAHGVMSTPGLAIDGAVLVTGRVPDATEVAALIRARA